MPTRPVVSWIHSSKDGVTPVTLYKTWMKASVFPPEQWCDINAQLRGLAREGEAGEEKDLAWAKARFTPACLKSLIVYAKATGEKHKVVFPELTEHSFELMWPRAKEFAAALSRPVKAKALINAERVEGEAASGKGGLTMECGTPSQKKKRRRALTAELGSLGDLQERIVRRRMFAFSPCHPRVNGPAAELRDPYREILVAELVALADEIDSSEGDDEGANADVLQTCDACLGMGKVRDVLGAALPGGKAAVCDKCVVEIALGHPERIPSHDKFHRYVKHAMRKKAQERQKICAFQGCCRPAKGPSTADVGCDKHAAKLADVLFMVSEGEFDSFGEDGAMALLGKVSGEAAKDAGDQPPDQSTGRAGGTPGSGRTGRGQQRPPALTCTLCNTRDDSVGGFEMTFPGAVAAPGVGERVACGQCRESLGTYMREQPALLANFKQRGMSERDQWGAVMGFAESAALQVPGCRPVPGFGTTPPMPPFARCVDKRCKCAASFNGQAGEHCCATCRRGSPCVENYHQRPFKRASAEPMVGKTPPSVRVDNLLNQIRSGGREQRERIARAIAPRRGVEADGLDERLSRAVAPPADAKQRRRVLAQSSLWTRLEKDSEDAMAMPEGEERDMAVRMASEKKLRTEMGLWNRLDPDRVTSATVATDLRNRPGRARVMRERTVYQFGVLLCRRVLDDERTSLSDRMRTYVEGSLKRFEYSAARLEVTYFTKQFKIEAIERKEATGLSETWFASRASKRMSAEKIDSEFHRVREAALHGKTLAAGNGYIVGGAAAGAPVLKKTKAAKDGKVAQALHKRLDKLSAQLIGFKSRDRQGGGGATPVH